MTTVSGFADGNGPVGCAGMQAAQKAICGWAFGLPSVIKTYFMGEISVMARERDGGEKMSCKRNIVIAAMVFLVLCLFMLWPNDSSQHQAEATLTWPDDWDAMNLPRIPDATITRIGGVRDQRGGVSIDVNTKMSLKEITEFIEEQFARLDYFAYRPDINADSYYNEFSSNDTDVSVDVKPNPEDPDNTRVTIVVRHERQVENVRTYRSSTRLD